MPTPTSLRNGALPLLVGMAILQLYGSRSGWELVAFILIAVSLLYWVTSSLKQGVDAVHEAAESTETVHYFGSHSFRVYVDDRDGSWLRASDVKHYLLHSQADDSLGRRFPTGYKKANPALDAWYVHTGTVKELVGRSSNEAHYRFLSWMTQTLVGLRRFERVMSDGTTRPAPPQKSNHWLARQWRGDIGLISAIGVGGIVAGAVIWLWTAISPTEDISLNYRLAALWALIQLALIAGGLYWWGRGVMLAAQRWMAADQSVVVALLATGLGFAGVAAGLSQAIDREQQYLITEWYPIMTDQDPKADLRFDPATKRILLKGELGFGTTNRLRALLAEHPGAKGIELHSPGGRTAEGRAARRLVQSHQLDTYVQKACASACVSIYLGGKERYITPTGQMGLHRSGHHWKADNGTLNPTDEAEAQYMRQLSIDEAFIQKSLKPSIHDIFAPSAEEVLAAGLATREWKL